MMTKAPNQQQTSAASSDINSSPQIDSSSAPTSGRQDQQLQHDALTSLFRSLTSLAGANHTNTMINSMSNPLAIGRPLNISFGLHQDSTRMAQNLTTNNSHPELASSIGSVVAAAVMRQQLTAAINHQQQQIPPASLPLEQQLQQINPNRLSGQHQQFSSFISSEIPQSSADLSFVNDQPTPSLMGTSNNQDQFTSFNNNNSSQQNQRINYCTICNKELCNKYFMKTHMLKMHGINLEMEQSSSEANHTDHQNRTDETTDAHAHDDLHTTESFLKATDLSKNPQTKCSKQLNDCKISASNSYQASNKSNTKISSSAAGSSKQTATSVMNGFAGNSMGGVVCDICNKELCSKYFLKVHKQNTHGIVTDYQDASQFVYPFVNPIAAPNPFMPQPLHLNSLMPPTSNILPFSSPFNNNINNQTTQASYADVESKSNSTKKSRHTIDDVKQQTKRGPNNSRAKSKNSQTNGYPEIDESNINPFYRLMLEQHKQSALSGHLQSPPATLSNIAQTFDPLGSNRMSTLMCFGTMGPFGSAGISPTMIVEMILRNQHLFSRNHKNNQPISQNQAAEKDKNNNAESKQKASGKTSKEANNSRYFTHYTEACPMCDRRFKSIKWLKTHMMNDHKQEIGTYMQMMLQNLYMNKGQQHLLPGQIFDQSSCYTPMEPCPIMQQSKYQPLISMCNSQGVEKIFPSEQINMIQSYLDQQHKQNAMQHKEQNPQMLDLGLEPSRKQMKISVSPPLVGHNLVHDISYSSKRSSPQRLLVNKIEDQQNDARQNNQLDLSTKCNEDLQDCELDLGMNYNLDSRCDKDISEMDEFTDSYSSSRSSSQNENIASDNNAESNDELKQVVKSEL